MPFIDNDFLLSTPNARKLYHEFAAEQPIIDYHCHLPPQEMAENQRFENLAAIWLGGDHYKWRAMRASGVPESHITGKAEPKEKFLAWAKTVPQTLRNPLYHWTHLELKRYFGIDTLLSPSTAEAIWDATCARMAEPDFDVWHILQNFKVEVVGTTDDPTDSLQYHEALKRSNLKTQVVPTFRPDACLRLDEADAFNQWVNRLEEVSGISCEEFEGFLEALKSRHSYFHEMGCRSSDHGLEHAHALFIDQEEVALIFDGLRAGRAPDDFQGEGFRSFMMEYVAQLNHSRGWVMQLHLGALRNQNSKLFLALGRDVGGDSIGDFPQTVPLNRFLDRLHYNDSLPKTIIYNLNPADNYAIGSMLGNFQGDAVPGKIQMGSGWWHLDQLEGMEWQMNALSNLGLLSRFVGMLTDSRSFLSFPRHEYFRRLLCNLLGNDMAKGLIPEDYELVGNLVVDICHRNARSYFGFGK